MAGEARSLRRGTARRGRLPRRALALGLAACAAWYAPARAEALSPQPAPGQARQESADPQAGQDRPACEAAADEPAEPAPPQFDDEVVVVGNRA